MGGRKKPVTERIMKQYEAVIQTLEKLGGIATLGQLNQEVFKIKECEWKTKTPFASIRRIVQENKNIYKIKPGLWALKSYQKKLEEQGFVVETEKNKNSKEVIEFNHSYYQGLLLALGNLRHYETFAPNQDKNKYFVTERLGDLRTLQVIPQYSYEYLVIKSSTIDVIWFNKRKMPNSFFEVEHSMDIQNSLLKYQELQDFHTKMYIVADVKRKPEFDKKLAYNSFENLRKEKRIKFLSYDDLEKQYRQALDLQTVQTLIL